ncbi:MAG: tRNA lysidine(34) synthetase TilS [Buchananella hordeovulneris]|nr:tRNA lysidine(34) synthetase TilS [Buchananella hordeovulneris]
MEASARPLSPPGPAALPVLRALRATLADLPGTPRLVVGCSGGADSLSLLLALAELTRPAGPLAAWRDRVVALHVDHGLRAESAAEGNWVADVARQAGLRPLCVRVDAHFTPTGAPRDGGPEAAARAARREAFAGALATGDVLLLGHTADDQAEQVLLSLARGAGLRAVAGIAPCSALDLAHGQATILRPLLGLRRAQTEAACAAFGVPFLQDPTNSVDGPWRAADGSPLRRSAVRARALPALSQALGVDVVPALARTAAQARADLEALDSLGQALFEQSRQAAAAAPPQAALSRKQRAATSATPFLGEGPVPPGAVGLDCGELARALPAVRLRALRLAGQTAGWEAAGITAKHLAALEELVMNYRGQGAVHLPGQVRAERRGKLLLLAPGDGANGHRR